MPTKSQTSTSGNEETCSKCQTRNTSSSTVSMENINPNMSFTNVISSRLSEQDNSYDALCSCQDQNCQCQHNQAWATSKWRPQNWTHWPLIKKSLIFTLVLAFFIWILVYLILHFKNDKPEDL